MSGIIALRIPSTIIGMGSTHSIANLVKEFKAAKILVITDEDIMKVGLINSIKLSLEEAGYKFDVFDGCRPNAPSSSVEKCSQVVKEGNYNLLIGVGGGSVMDTTKAVRVLAPNDMTLQDLFSGKEVNKVLPMILVPTTAGTGSEWDEGAVITDESIGRKRWIVRDYFLADVTVLDSELTLNLPKRVTADTGMDALAHAIEPYISPKANIISDMFAETAIKLVSDNLRLAYTRGSQATEARYKMSIAAAIGMKALIVASSSLAHALNFELSYKTHITHGAAVALLLPHNMQFELRAAPERFAKIAELMGEKVDRLSSREAAQKAVEAVKRLSKDVGMAQTLSEVGITEADIPKFVDNLINFRPLKSIQDVSLRNVSREDLVQIYTAAL